MQHHAAAQRMPEQIRAVDPGSVHDIAQIGAHCVNGIFPAPYRLVGQAMAPEIEGEHLPTRPKQRRHRVAKRVDGCAPPVDEDGGRSMRGPGFKESNAKSAPNREHARRDARDTSRKHGGRRESSANALNALQRSRR